MRSQPRPQNGPLQTVRLLPLVLTPAHREESDPRLVAGAESVRLRSFSTRVHKVDTCVAYKGDTEEGL